MASCYAEPSTLSTWIGDEDEVEKESGDESEESEPEQSFVPVVRRKVSFADAFGLDLVSVKEFDNKIENAERREGEEYYLSCIFSVPTSDEELELRLQQDKLELESIELLPGSSTIRGTVRVLNLSYHKVVYVRTTLDGWQNYFDQLAEYVPGSSNGVTDRFSFQLTLMPPFPPDGARVEFCLRYDSSAGIFWANNGGMNYVLFCHQRAGRALKEKEEGQEREAEENNQKGKKSCLKAIKKGTCAGLKSMDMSIELSESHRSTENKKGTTQHNEQCRSGDALEESCKTLAERRNRRRATQLAYLQDYFSHRKTNIQLGQPSHRGKSVKDVNVEVPMPPNDIPVMTGTSSSLQGCSRKEHNGHMLSIPPDHQIPFLPLDCDRNISSSSLSHLNTSEIISEAKRDVLEKEATELANDAWKAFPDGTDRLDNHNNALDQNSLLYIVGLSGSPTSNTECDVSDTGDKILSLWNAQESAVGRGNGSHQRFNAVERQESNPAKQAHDSSHMTEVLVYHGSESIWCQSTPGVTVVPQERHTFSERPFSENDPMPLPKPREIAHADDATESLKSKPGDGVLVEECTSSKSFLVTELKVKENIHTIVEDTLTFPRTRHKPFTDSREFLERQYIDESGEPKIKKEHVRKVNEDASQTKRVSWSECSEKDLMMLESRLQENDEERSDLKEFAIEKSLVCDEGEPHKQTECFDGGKEEALWCELGKKVFSDFSERQGEEISLVENKVENGLKAEGQGICERQSEDDDDINKELHKLQSSPEACLCTPSVCITSHTNILSVFQENPFHAHHKSIEDEETLMDSIHQDLQDPVGAQFASAISRTASYSVGKISSWLLAFWAKMSNLSYITAAFVCAILFVIFVTAYLHDLPVCQVIYLLSACWWCRRGLTKHVTTADSVD